MGIGRKTTKPSRRIFICRSALMILGALTNQAGKHHQFITKNHPGCTFLALWVTLKLVTTQVKVVKGLYTEVRNVQHVARGRVSRVFALIDRESFEYTKTRKTP